MDGILPVKMLVITSSSSDDIITWPGQKFKSIRIKEQEHLVVYK
jgi:hypothetical protein